MKKTAAKRAAERGARIAQTVALTVGKEIAEPYEAAATCAGAGTMLIGLGIGFLADNVAEQKELYAEVISTLDDYLSASGFATKLSEIKRRLDG